MTSSGEATMDVSNNGLSAWWDIDDALVTFSRSSSSGGFDSPQYTFPVATDTGTSYGYNHWKITPTSQSEITGILDWNNNQGFSAEYPIEMDFVSLAVPGAHALCEGFWTMSIGPLVCIPYSGLIPPTVIAPSSFPLFPALVAELDVIYSSAVPVGINYDNLNAYMTLPSVSTNVYGYPNPNAVFGLTVDSGLMPLLVTGGFQMIATSTQSIKGVIVINGAGVNPCFGSGTFNMSYSGPPC